MLGRTRSAARWVRIGLALMAPVALVSPFGGCGLDTQGSAAECKQDVDCVKVDQPCQIWRCENLGCASTSQPDGLAPTQIPGDCFQATCDDGTTNQVFDDTDVDDLNPCTTRECVKTADGGEVISTNVKAGDPCKLGQADGLCKDGVCEVVCETGADCDDSNPCTDGQCNEGKCDFTGKHAFVLPDKDEKDCLQDICNGATPATVPSLTELPDDSNECTGDTCVDGVKTFTALTDQACGMNGDFVCSPEGKCVGCNAPGQCGADTDCLTRTCEDQECGIDYQPDLFPVPAQTPGDCRSVVCDGNGNQKEIDANDPDPSTEVPNDCQTPSCSMGTKGQAPSGETTCAVNGGSVCTTTGVCVACNVAGDCGSAGTCKAFECNMNSCVNQNILAGMDPNNNCTDQTASSCGTTGDCDGGGSCAVYANGTQCVAPSCNSGNDQITGQKTCNGSGTCGGPPAMDCPNNYGCMSATACNTTCSNNGQCKDNYACSGGNCRKAPGQGCSGGGECASNNCVDGVCCTASSCPTCSSCNLNGNGTCQAHPSGQQDPTGCSGANMACDSAQQCKKVNGQTCGNGSECVTGFCRNGRCCNTACDADCYDCDIAGHIGECFPTPAGQDDGGCTGASMSCNGSGVCQ